ncbi:MAG TPA: DUF6350 family protein [Sporichthyaceae bacterium]|nr:DUF6350 family protein [Sporichthyaceae bacterium]
MVTILTQPSLVRAAQSPQPARGRFWQVTAGAIAAVVAASVCMAVLCAGTVLLWATGPQTTSSGATAPLRTAASLWLFALRVPVHTTDGPIRLAPLAVTGLLVWACVRSAGWAARYARAHETGQAAAVVLGFTFAFTFAAAAAARCTLGHGLAVATLPAMAAAVPFGALAAVAGVSRHTWALAALLRRTRPWGAMLARAVGAAGLVLFGGGIVIVIAAMAVHRDSVAHSFALSGGGWSGGIGLALLSLIFLPTAAFWAIAVAAGPGVALATDSRLDLGGADLGAMPNLPLVHALPGTGSLPWVAYLTVAVPLLAGISAGWVVRPGAGRRWFSVVGVAAGAGALTGVLAGCAAQLSGGGVGGRLDRLGPSGPRVGLALATELGFAAAVTAALRVLGAPRPVPPPLALLPHARSATEEIAAEATADAAEVTEAVPEGEVVEPVEEPTDIVADVEPSPDASDEPSEPEGSASLTDLEDLEDTQEIPVVHIEPAAAVAAETDILTPTE